MLRILLIIYFVVSFSTSSFASSFKGLSEIINRGEIIVSFTPNNTAIFTIVDEQGNISGIDMDVAKIIADALGVKLRVKKSAKDWNAVIDEVSRGDADFGISFLSATLERSKKVYFSNSYASIKQALMINNLSIAKKRSDNIFVIKDMFTGKDSLKLGVYSGSSYEIFAKNLFPGVKVFGYDTTDQLINATLSGEIDATLIDDLELFSVFSKNPGLKMKLTEVILQDQSDFISIAVNPANRDLLDFINNVLMVKMVNYSVESAYKYSLDKLKYKGVE